MQIIGASPLPTPLVDLAVATEFVNDEITKIRVDLRSRIALTPTAIQYFTTNNLLPEVLSRAGLNETTTYSAITQVSTSQLGGEYLYRLQLTL